MKMHGNLAAAALLVSLMGGTALAAETANLTSSPEQQAANRDFGKVSKDGSKAEHDISLARVAIFDGETSKAKLYVDDAKAALARAKADDTVFTKAESELKPGPGAKQAAPADAAASTTPIAWIPVDGQMALAEDFVATPAKAAGVAKANEALKHGRKAEALATLKLADIDVYFIETVAPLEATVAGVDKAATLIADGHYYEANQALKAVEDGMRVDSQALMATPEKLAAGKHS